MQTNDHQVRDYSAVLDEKYGAIGTREREQFEQEAWNFYSGQILLDARKEAKVTHETAGQFLFHKGRANGNSGTVTFRP